MHKKSRFGYRNSLFLILTNAVLLGCAPGSLMPSPATITVSFTGDCPDASNAGLTITEDVGKRLLFVSSPAGKDYSITFDPFVGKPYKSDKDGEIKTLPLNASALPRRSEAKQGQENFTFKYTIHAPGCDPVDPRIVVRRS